MVNNPRKYKQTRIQNVGKRRGSLEPPQVFVLLIKIEHKFVYNRYPQFSLQVEMKLFLLVMASHDVIESAILYPSSWMFLGS